MTKQGLRFFIVCTLIVLSRSTPASGAGLSYADQMLFPHGYVEFKHAGPLSMTDYPFAASGRKLVFESSYRALYNMTELADSRGALAYSHGVVTAGVAVASFGKADYFQQLGISIFASRRTGRFVLGGAFTYSRISFGGGYTPVAAFTENAGVSYQRGSLIAYMVARTINRPRYCVGADRLAREGEIGLSYRSGEYLDSQIKTLFIERQKRTAQLVQAFQLNKFAQINWSLVLSPVRFGAGVKLEKGHLGFGYLFSHHPVLGPTHTVSLLLF